MRWSIWFVLAGCNQVFGLDPTVVQMFDARPDAPGCSGSQFGDPQPVASNVFNDAPDPSASDDPNEVWYTDISNGFHVAFARRASETAAFDSTTTFSTMAGDFDPALSADGNTLVFASTRLGSPYVLEYDRSSRSDAFGAAMQVVPIGDAGNGVDLSPDGNTLYYVDGNRDLRVVQRASRAEPWTGTDEVLAANVAFPSVSPDGIELYYTGQADVYRRTRTSTQLPFDATATLVMQSAADPDVWPDARHLYINRGSGLVVLTRTCN